MIDDHYNFLDHLEEMEESSSNEDDKSSIFGMNFAHKTKRSRSLLSLENDTEGGYVIRINSVHCIVVHCRRIHQAVGGPCCVQVSRFCAGIVQHTPCVESSQHVDLRMEVLGDCVLEL